MEYLYLRKKDLEKQIKKLEKNCFNPQVRPVLKELRARLDEIKMAIRELEAE